MTFRIGFDVGGTFTDIVVADDGGVRCTHKILTSASDPITPMIEGMRAALTKIGAQPSEIEQVVHGTTLVTNAVIERKGAVTALITTQGFRDVAEIGREWRYDMYDLFLDAPPVLVPRDLRFELEERTGGKGNVVIAVKPEEVASVLNALPKNVKSVALCFLNSYAAPKNERAAAQIIKELRPDLSLSISVDIAPEIREFERLSTTITNAYVQPLVEPYLGAFQKRLKDAGVQAQLFIVLSNGGLVTAEDASRFPVRIIESGPAAGVTGAACLGRKSAEKRILAFDMGGTTAKVTFIDDGQPVIAREFEVARAYRLRPGSGIPLKVPAIELLEVGAGGGSLASVDSMGRIRVGPESAGSSPGPICYGLGGKQPTVTDADVTLGYLDAEKFLGGRMRLRKDEAAAGILKSIGEPLGLDSMKAAWGIHQVINENMANALRVHSGERGKDPRKYAMIAFGGAGGVHACRVASSLRISTVIFPELASVLSAFGMLAAPLTFDFVRTSRQSLASFGSAAVNSLYEEMEGEGRALLMKSGAEPRDISIERTCDMRFAGQGYEIEVPVPQGRLKPGDENSLREGFHTVYERLYGRAPTHLQPEALNWRVRLTGRKVEIDQYIRRDVPALRRQPAVRCAYFPETGFNDTPVIERSELSPGDTLVGPCIVQQEDTTIVAPPNWSGLVDDNLNLILRHQG